jgi:8-oxo-dGTP pyrophosphatase MutT (NUDIX family)
MIRSQEKPNYPLYPECTAGGSALLGEDPLTCIRRELREETGIEWDDFEEVNVTVREFYSTIFHSYLCTVDWPKDAITMQAGETEGYEWLSEEEFIGLLNSNRMIPGQPERMEGWFRKMGYLK